MFIYIKDFYQDVSNIFGPINALDFLPSNQGFDIQNFQMIPEGISETFCDIVGKKIKLNEKSGFFRKPYVPIHFENYNQETLFVGAVAFEKVKFCTYKHKENNSFSVYSIENNLPEFVNNNCFDKTK